MEKNKKDDWIPTANRFVAYIDIMGFKDMVAKTPHMQIYKMMRKVNENRQLNESTKWGDLDSLIRTTTYSDSIMVYSKDGSYDSLRHLIATTSSFSYDLFLDGIPHKGAVAFGKMTLDRMNSIFFGQPLIDAFLLQEELNFYGIIVHATAENKMDFYSKTKTVIHVRNYLCPLKNGMSQHFTVCPFYAELDEFDDDATIKENEKLYTSVKKLRYKTSGHIRKYIDNTLAYLDVVRQEENEEKS